MEMLAQQELDRTMKKLAAGNDHQQTLTEFSTRLINKLTHYPTLGLRKIAGDDREELLSLAQYLFNTPTDQNIL